MKAKFALLRDYKCRDEDEKSTIELFMLRLNYVQKLKASHGL